MHVSEELRERLRYTAAPFWKRFGCTVCDLSLAIGVNVWIFVLIAGFTNGTLDGDQPTFNNLVPKGWTMMVYSIYMLWYLFMYLVIMPLYYGPQTIFSNFFNIKAITLDGSAPAMHNWFKANFVMVFLVMFANLCFFSIACGVNQDIKLVDLASIAATPAGKYFMPAIKLLFSAVVLIQVHYLFTVALSKNAINWFTRYSNLVYVDTKKESLFLQEKVSRELLTGQEEEAVEVKEVLMEDEDDLLEDEELEEEVDSEDLEEDVDVEDSDDADLDDEEHDNAEEMDLEN